MIGDVITVNGTRLRIVYEERVTVWPKEGVAYEYVVVGTVPCAD